MISVDEALSTIDQHRPDWGTEIVALTEANGRQLAEDIIAPFCQPKYSMSVMDGYALRKTDSNGTMTIIGESRAGAPFDGDIKSGQAVRIFTGAILPQGADHIEIQEYANVSDGQLTFPQTSVDRRYIRDAGSDFVENDLLFQKGEKITPAIIMAIATANIAQVRVLRLPSLAIIMSGDELKNLGDYLDKNSIINSNGPGLIALLGEWGFPVIDLGIVADSPDVIKERVESCEADIIISIGGASVGKYDYMKQVFSEVGYDTLFTKVAVKPGKPTWFSKYGEKLVLGLPGNPSSAWVCAHIFLAHLLGRQLHWKTLTVSSALAKNSNRDTFLRAQLTEDNHVQPLPSQDSGLILPLTIADVLIFRKANSIPCSSHSQQPCLLL